MTNVLPLTALALALGLGSLPALAQDAQPPRPEQSRHHEGMEARYAAKLQLTDAQKASIKAIRDKHMAQLAGRRKELEAARTAFRDAEQKPESKPEDLKALHRTLADLMFEAQLEHRAMRLEIRALLTPEQREKSARMEGRMEGMSMGHRGHGPEAGGPMGKMEGGH